ncbi:MBL fold metallo-hydrolase [Halobacterium bonnevillei]|uniref:MBL fold metallo-hydrolase n=1 Tax=Halobacterium bonnevillei TaxID=2692200 RepID=A0A6B0SJU3_9EURY|nr:MBL fold metallo-hydrolase [Halobacterium bonnevillei]MXR20041.1 MBL fold metallo-hydrolase [Halobacterium bonnevillei]
MEVTNGVYVFQFDTEYFGNDRTWHPTGVETDRGLLLFDVGGPGDADALEAALEADGFAYDDVDKIILTHHDYDHLGCLEAVHDRADAEVVAHERAAPYVTADVRMLKRPEEPYGGVPVDIELTGGERFHTHAGPVRAIFTPGHAPGHLVYHFEDANVLVAGDLLRADGEFLGGPKRSVTPDLATSRDAIGSLVDLDVEQIVCFHGGPIEATGDDIQRVYDGLLEETVN